MQFQSIARNKTVSKKKMPYKRSELKRKTQEEVKEYEKLRDK